MTFDRLSLDLAKLFRDPDMFESRDDWRDAGFDVLERSSDGKIMVASHPSVRGLLFKKYTNDISLKEQQANYACRIEGARKLQEFIDARHLQHVVVPQKWLLELSSDFGSKKRSSHVLIVEHLDLMDEGESIQAYRDIDEDVLRELSTVFFAFRGLDSTAKNVPFTKDGKIAFIDTEHWYRRMRKKKHKRSKKPFLRHIGKHLSRSRRVLAEKILKELEDLEDE